MIESLQFYVGGKWVDPVRPATLDVYNPATEEAFTQISMGSAADVNKAVAAAKAAFPKFSRTSKAERLALLKRILEEYNKRFDDIAKAVSDEMGAPMSLAALAGLIAALTYFFFHRGWLGIPVVLAAMGYLVYSPQDAGLVAMLVHVLFAAAVIGLWGLSGRVRGARQLDLPSQ